MPRRGGRRPTIVAVMLCLLGAYLGWDAYCAGSLWRYRLIGYCAAITLSLPLLTQLLFGRRGHRWWRRIAFLLVPLSVALVLAEVMYRCFAPPRELPAQLLPDARLGHVMVPGTAGTDARGYRNAKALTQADVLVIGDSQTWGFGVTREQTFTYLLADALGRTTYQMANGSYGPVQYRELLQRGLSLHPKVVIVAMYFGNDLIDAADYAGLLGAEATRTEGRSYVVRDNIELVGEPAPNQTMACLDGILAASYLLDSAATVIKARLRGGALDAQPGAVFFPHATASTWLLPSYRLPALQPESDSIRDGIAISNRCWRDIAARCAQQQVRCVLLLIPTKGFTYGRWQPELTAVQELVAAEHDVRQEILAGARSAGLTVVDMADALVAAMAAAKMPWFATGDGHINAVGHQIAMQLLQEHCR